MSTLNTLNLDDIPIGLPVSSYKGNHGKVIAKMKEGTGYRYDSVKILWNHGKTSIVFLMDCEFVKLAKVHSKFKQSLQFSKH